MINISGYVTGIDKDIVDKKNFLSVNSCGYHKLINQSFFDTIRPQGRLDYQLLYVAKGCANFRIGSEMQTVDEGKAIIYSPNEPQYYYYSLSDKPEVYWLHFSGAQIDVFLKNLGYNNGQLYKIGTNNAYISIFDKIISEIRLKHQYFFELANLYAIELISLMSGNLSDSSPHVQRITEQLDNVIELINKNPHCKHSIMEYARLCNMSTRWFVSCFSLYTGMTPQQYITSVRISKDRL